MARIPKILHSAMSVLTLLVLLAVPYARTAQYPSNPGGQSFCNCCCSCCGEKTAEKAVDIGGKCGCDISKPEPLADLPPATVNPNPDQSRSDVVFETVDISFDGCSPHARPVMPEVSSDGTGPPLYLVNSSFLI